MKATDYFDDSGFVGVPKWMYLLDLTLAETVAYGIIYVFSQERQGCYFGSLEYLARYCRVSRRHAIRILQKLEDDGLIIRESHPGSTTHFYAVDKRTALKLHPCQNVTGDNMSPHPCYNVTPTRDIMSPNKKVDSKEDIKETHTLKEQPEKIKFGQRLEMTQKQYDSVLAKYGPTDTPLLIQLLDDYLINHPTKKVLDAPAAIRNWVVDKLNQRKIDEQRLKNAQQAGQRVTSSNNGGIAVGYGERAMENARRLEELLKN